MNNSIWQSSIKWTFGIFAIVGFVSSIIGIYQFFSTPMAVLEASIKEYKVELPKSYKLNIEYDQRLQISSAIETALEKKCNPVEVSYDGLKAKNFHYSAVDCRKMENTKSELEKFFELTPSSRKGYEIELKNSGGLVATNINLVSPKSLEIEAKFKDRRSFDVRGDKDGKQFRLPNLNPGEVINIIAIQSENLSPLESIYLEEDEDRPTINFSEGYTRYNLYVLSERSVAELSNFIEETPWLLLAIIFIFCEIIILGIVAIPIMIVDALSNGIKPIAIFRNDYNKIRYCDEYRLQHDEVLFKKDEQGSQIDDIAGSASKAS